MPNAGKVVKLYAKEAPVGVLDGALVGFLTDPAQAGEWLVTRQDEGFRLTAKGTEETVTAEGPERAPVAVRPTTPPPPSGVSSASAATATPPRSPRSPTSGTAPM